MSKFIDITGKKFGKWTVIEKLDIKDKFRRTSWKCVCDCGTERVRYYSELKSGHSKSCGCDTEYRYRNIVDISGERFGKLLVIERVIQNDKKEAMWKCICDCGKENIVRGSSLRAGKTKSCGCLVGETTKKIHSRHGDYQTRIYSIWNNMKQRCFNENNENYKYYGSRGITICEEWMDFNNFREWAKNNGYTDELTIDRIDVNGNYCPENCRWETRKEQNRNRTNTIMVDGKPLSAITEELNLNYDFIYRRLKKGINFKQACCILEEYKKMQSQI